MISMSIPKLTLITIATMLLIFSIAFAQTDTLWVPVDTIYFGGYTLVNYKIVLDEETNWGNFDIFRGAKKILTSITWYPPPELYTYCYHSGGAGPICPLKDLNGDGKDEVIVVVGSGGNNGWESNSIYSIDTSAVLIGNFDGINTGLNALRLLDIDGDSIPELIFNDMNYSCWPEGCAGAPAPLVIWKWTGQKYRLANIKFKNYLECIHGWRNVADLRESIDSWVEIFYKKPGHCTFPPFLAHVMLEYIYMGEYQKADSVFYNLWPKVVEGEDLHHNEIWDHAKASPFWQELQESNW